MGATTTHHPGGITAISSDADSVSIAAGRSGVLSVVLTIEMDVLRSIVATHGRSDR